MQSKPLSIVPPAPDKNLLEVVKLLETYGGNLKRFLVAYKGSETGQYESILFQIYEQLNLEENRELLKRWIRALQRSKHIRLELLQCRALQTLEQFDSQTPKSSSPEIAFAKVILDDVLQARNQLALKPFTAQKNSPSLDLTDELDEDIKMLSEEIA